MGLEVVGDVDGALEGLGVGVSVGAYSCVMISERTGITALEKSEKDNCKE